MKTLLLSVLSILSISACSIARAQHDGGHRTIRPLHDTELVSSLDEHIESAEIITLDGAVYIPTIKKMLLTGDGDMIILAATGVYKFMPNGALAFTATEWEAGCCFMQSENDSKFTVEDICLSADKSEIWALSFNITAHRYEVLKWEIATGVPLPSVTISETDKRGPEALCPSEKGGFYLIHDNPNEMHPGRSDTHLLWKYDNRGTVIGKDILWRDYNLVVGNVFTMFSQNSGNTYLTMPLAPDNISYRIRKGKCEPAYRFDYGDKQLPAEFAFKEGRQPRENLRDITTGDHFSCTMLVQQTHKHLCFGAIGPHAKGNNFVVNLRSGKGIRWEYNMFMNFYGSDQKYFYAVCGGVPDPSEFPENRIENPLYDYIEKHIGTTDLAEGKNVKIVKLKFR